MRWGIACGLRAGALPRHQEPPDPVAGGRRLAGSKGCEVVQPPQWSRWHMPAAQFLFPLCFGTGLGYRLHRCITGRQRYSPATEANGRFSQAELGTGATEICAPDGRRNRVLGRQTLLRGVAIRVTGLTAGKDRRPNAPQPAPPAQPRSPPPGHPRGPCRDRPA